MYHTFRCRKLIWNSVSIQCTNQAHNKWPTSNIASKTQCRTKCSCRSAAESLQRESHAFITHQHQKSNWDAVLMLATKAYQDPTSIKYVRSKIVSRILNKFFALATKETVVCFHDKMCKVMDVMITLILKNEVLSTYLILPYSAFSFQQTTCTPTSVNWCRQTGSCKTDQTV